MLTTTGVAVDPAPTKMTAGARARAALEEGRRHKIDGIVLKMAESNSMSSTANGSARGGGSAGAVGREHNWDRDKERSTVQKLENIVD